VPNIFRSPAKAHADLTAVASPFANEDRRPRITRICCPVGTDLTAPARDVDHRTRVCRLISSVSLGRFPAAEQRSSLQSLSSGQGVIPSVDQINIAADAADQHLDTNGNPLRPFDD